MIFYKLAQSSRTEIEGICAFTASVTSESSQNYLVPERNPDC
ncbi:MAG: hypothetical protein QOE96_3741 [Blastocatellia bacterium]|nr:hypothetical protein [Blastocatellia bacterium]